MEFGKVQVFREPAGVNGRHVVMDFDEETPITLEFPPEPPPFEELTDDDAIDERPIVTLH